MYEISFPTALQVARIGLMMNALKTESSMTVKGGKIYGTISKESFNIVQSK
jgi:hypothetical protein